MQKPFHHLARGIFVKEGRVLIAHAIGHNNTFLPGGHIEFGESAKDALIREIKEEIGVNCVLGKFLGIVEHKWERQGVLHCELNQLFEVDSDEIDVDRNPKSMESHIEFYWCNPNELDHHNLQPYPLRSVIRNYLSGSKDVWWESSINEEIDESNRN